MTHQDRGRAEGGAVMMLADIAAVREDVDVMTFVRRLKRAGVDRATMTTAIDALHAAARAGSRHSIAESEVGSPYHRLVAAVCATCKVSPAALRSPLRARKTARPRQIVMYLATTDLGLSTTVVGRLLGGRDHSTVIHGRNKIAKLIEANAIERDLVDVVRRNSGKAR